MLNKTPTNRSAEAFALEPESTACFSNEAKIAKIPATQKEISVNKKTDGGAEQLDQANQGKVNRVKVGGMRGQNWHAAELAPGEEGTGFLVWRTVTGDCTETCSV